MTRVSGDLSSALNYVRLIIKLLTNLLAVKRSLEMLQLSVRDHFNLVKLCSITEVIPTELQTVKGTLRVACWGVSTIKQVL